MPLRTTPVPVPLPARRSKKAPLFDPANTLTLWEYFLDYENLAQAALLTPGEKIQHSTNYVGPADAAFWQSLDEYNLVEPDWEAFKKAVLEAYPGSEPRERWSLKDLEKLCEAQSGKRIQTRGDFAEFYREFTTISRALLDKGLISELDTKQKFWKALDPPFKKRLIRRLEIVDNEYHEEKVVGVEVVRKEANHILQKTPSITSSTVKGEDDEAPTEGGAKIKNELFDMEKFTTNMMTVMASTIETAMSAIARAQYGGPTIRAASVLGRVENCTKMVGAGHRPRIGDAGAVCFMCGQADHFLSSCSLLQQYEGQGRIRKDVSGRYVLAQGENIPSGPPTIPWYQRINAYYDQLPEARLQTTRVELDNLSPVSPSPVKASFSAIEPSKDSNSAYVAAVRGVEEEVDEDDELETLIDAFIAKTKPRSKGDQEKRLRGGTTKQSPQESPSIIEEPVNNSPSTPTAKKPVDKKTNAPATTVFKPFFRPKLQVPHVYAFTLEVRPSLLSSNEEISLKEDKEHLQIENEGAKRDSPSFKPQITPPELCQSLSPAPEFRSIVDDKNSMTINYVSSDPLSYAAILSIRLFKDLSPLFLPVKDEFKHETRPPDKASTFKIHVFDSKRISGYEHSWMQLKREDLEETAVHQVSRGDVSEMSTAKESTMPSNFEVQFYKQDVTKREAISPSFQPYTASQEFTLNLRLASESKEIGLGRELWKISKEYLLSTQPSVTALDLSPGSQKYRATLSEPLQSINPEPEFQSAVFERKTAKRSMMYLFGNSPASYVNEPGINPFKDISPPSEEHDGPFLPFRDKSSLIKDLCLSKALRRRMNERVTVVHLSCLPHVALEILARRIRLADRPLSNRTTLSLDLRFQLHLASQELKRGISLALEIEEFIVDRDTSRRLPRDALSSSTALSDLNASAYKHPPPPSEKRTESFAPFQDDAKHGTRPPDGTSTIAVYAQGSTCGSCYEHSRTMPEGRIGWKRTRLKINMQTYQENASKGEAISLNLSPCFELYAIPPTFAQNLSPALEYEESVSSPSRTNICPPSNKPSSYAAVPSMNVYKHPPSEEREELSVPWRNKSIPETRPPDEAFTLESHVCSSTRMSIYERSRVRHETEDLREAKFKRIPRDKNTLITRRAGDLAILASSLSYQHHSYLLSLRAAHEPKQFQLEDNSVDNSTSRSHYDPHARNATAPALETHPRNPSCPEEYHEPCLPFRDKHELVMRTSDETATPGVYRLTLVYPSVSNGNKLEAKTIETIDPALLLQTLLLSTPSENRNKTARCSSDSRERETRRAQQNHFHSLAMLPNARHSELFHFVQSHTKKQAHTLVQVENELAQILHHTFEVLICLKRSLTWYKLEQLMGTNATFTSRACARADTLSCETLPEPESVIMRGRRTSWIIGRDRPQDGRYDKDVVIQERRPEMKSGNYMTKPRHFPQSIIEPLSKNLRHILFILFEADKMETAYATLENPIPQERFQKQPEDSRLSRKEATSTNWARKQNEFFMHSLNNFKFGYVSALTRIIYNYSTQMTVQTNQIKTADDGASDLSPQEMWGSPIAWLDICGYFLYFIFYISILSSTIS